MMRGLIALVAASLLAFYVLTSHQIDEVEKRCLKVAEEVCPPNYCELPGSHP